MAYEASTQHLEWTFTAGQLANMRAEVNAATTQRLCATRANLPAGGYLSVEEEYEIIKYYCGMAKTVAKKHSLPDKVLATGMTFLKRFYLKFSVMDYHPRETMITCMHLACKVEEVSQNVDDFARTAKVHTSTILKLEVPILDGIKFHLMVFHPFYAIRGLIDEIQSAIPASHREPLAQEATEIARMFMTTDAIFTCTPSQIALAAVMTAASDMNLTIQGAIDRLLATAPNAEGLRVLLAELTSPEYLDAVQPNQERCKDIDLKLRGCRNELLDMESEAFKERERRKEAERDARDKAKAEAESRKQREDMERLLGVPQSDDPMVE